MHGIYCGQNCIVNRLAQLFSLAFPTKRQLLFKDEWQKILFE